MARRNYSSGYQVFTSQHVLSSYWNIRLISGNPVSALVTYWLFVVPTLKFLMGSTQPHHPVTRVQVRFHDQF